MFHFVRSLLDGGFHRCERRRRVLLGAPGHVVTHLELRLVVAVAVAAAASSVVERLHESRLRVEVAGGRQGLLMDEAAPTLVAVRVEG